MEDSFPDEYIFAIFTKYPWFADIPIYLATGKLPSYFFPREKRKIIQMSASYSWVNEELFKTSPYHFIRTGVQEDEITEILKACHDEPCGGHFVHKITT